MASSARNPDRRRPDDRHSPDLLDLQHGPRSVLIFRDADCGAVPILEDGKPVGLLTDRDVALALTEHGENLLRLPVSDVMTRGSSPWPRPRPSRRSPTGSPTRRSAACWSSTAGQLQGIIAWADIALILPPEQLGKVVNDVVEHILKPTEAGRADPIDDVGSALGSAAGTRDGPPAVDEDGPDPGNVPGQLLARPSEATEAAAERLPGEESRSSPRSPGRPRRRPTGRRPVGVETPRPAGRPTRAG